MNINNALLATVVATTVLIIVVAAIDTFFGEIGVKTVIPISFVTTLMAVLIYRFLEKTA